MPKYPLDFIVFTKFLTLCNQNILLWEIAYQKREKYTDFLLFVLKSELIGNPYLEIMKILSEIIKFLQGNLK